MSKSAGASYLKGWKKTFVYTGNATRKDFWSFILINTIVIFIIAGGTYLILVEVIADHTSRGGMALVWSYFVFLPLCGIAPLILFFPILSLGIRRMHDIGRSGWWFGGFPLFGVFGMPVVGPFISRITDKWLSAETGSIVFTVIYAALGVVTCIIPVWLCCKPTKIKAPISSSDVMS
ncbi:TPA: DUF805 domain-containing protein [Salmonella enterica subsp. diarizonae serovar 61:l,v:z35]|nr:DUF805 domain-containing protein [Salmonella enterica subsp. enterica serovar Newport]